MPACLLVACCVLALARSASAGGLPSAPGSSASVASTISAVDALVANQVAALQQRSGPSPAEGAPRVLPQAAMVEGLSAQRTANGLSPVRFSTEISAASSGYGRRLLRSGSFQHARHYLAAGFRFGGEILALELSHHPNVAQVIARWMQSPEHRPVILNPVYDHVGIGMIKGTFRGSPATVWVVRFAAH